MIDGKLEVVNEHRNLAIIGSIEFAGEKSFISDAVANAIVVVSSEVSCYAWSKSSLDKLFRKRRTIQSLSLSAMRY